MPMTDAQSGLLTSVFVWTYGILSPFAGFVAERFNRSKIVILSLFVWSSVTGIHVTGIMAGSSPGFLGGMDGGTAK